MEQFYEGLKNLITQDLVSKAAKSIGENEEKTASAVSTIVPGLLNGLLKTGAVASVKDVVAQAQNVEVLPNLDEIFSGTISEEQEILGNNFLNAILGEKKDKFVSGISSDAGISSSGINKLLAMVAPLVARFIGNKTGEENLSIAQLISQIGEEKDKFAALLPSSVASLFSFNEGKKAPASQYEEPEKKSKNNWWMWLLLLIIVIALIFWWRSCNKRSVDTDKVIAETEAVADSIKDKASEAVQNIKEKMEFELPNGIKLNAFGGGIEDQMIAFLKSDKYAQLPEDSLKTIWFNFDNIEFVHGSRTELTEDSYPQLNNIVEILKHFKDVKVKVGGYTDKTGSAATNKEISQERANTIKAYLEKGGINASMISAEGYGDEFAKYPADAPDADRAHDRIIALRFVK